MTIDTPAVERDQARAARSTPTASDRVIELAARYALIVLLVLAVAVCSLTLPDTFATAANIKSIASSQAIVALLSLAVVFPLIVGEFDLSVGYTMGLAQAFTIGLMSFSGLPIPVAVVVVIVMTGVVGAVIGLIVAYTNIHSLIVTLAMGSVLSGITYWYTEGNVIFEGIPDGFKNLARNELFGIPLPFVYLLVIALVAAYILARTSTGRRMYAIGGNRSAAQLVGIRVKPTIVMAFALSGLLAGLAGVLIASRLNSAQAGLGPNFLLPAFAAAYLGATVIRPGTFNPIGAVVAVYLLATVSSGLKLGGVPSWAESVFNGAALLIAVGVSHRIAILRRRRAERRVDAG